MRKLTILCDADDTIENLSIHWIAELNQIHNKTVRKEHVRSWDMRKAYPDLTAEEVFAPLYRNDFWNKITPIEGSAYYMERLMEDGHTLYIVTASNLETSDAKTAKLLELFPFINKKQIIFTEQKQQIPGDLLIDDGIHNLLGGKYQKFLFHQPNNADFNEKNHDITRVHDWKEIYERVSNLAV